MKNKKSIILLSGGLDSLVSLAVCKEEYNIELALTFNYGQKAFHSEYIASKNLADYYNIKHEIITLDWLKNISNSTLTTNQNVPELNANLLDNKKTTSESANLVWIPNRNALFINIAACYADSKNYTHIIIGANKEEGQTFKDNSPEFIKAINLSLANSTNNAVIVYAPLINLAKKEIVYEGLKHKAPFNFVHSCYLNEEKHCGKCESCLRLRRALELNNRSDIISQIF